MKKHECKICDNAGEHSGSVVCAEAYDTLWDENQRLREDLGKLQRRNRWRPISEIHEDFGPCVCINLFDDPGCLEIHWCNENDFDGSRWTHFVRVPGLLTEDAERLIEERKAQLAAAHPVEQEGK